MMSYLNSCKVIRMKRGRVLEKTIKQKKKVEDSQPRKLDDGEDDDLNLNDLPPRYSFNDFVTDLRNEVMHCVRVYLPSASIITQEQSSDVYVNKKLLFNFSYKEVDDEELKYQEVQYEFKNLAIESKFSLQKVRLNDEVKSYVRMYIGGYLLLVGQTITSLLQVETDIKAVLYLSTFGDQYQEINLNKDKYDSYPRINSNEDGEEEGGGERRLLQNYNSKAEELQPKLRGIITNQELDVKNMKFISHRASVQNAARELMQRNNIGIEYSKIPERRLQDNKETDSGTEDDPLEFIPMDDPKYIHPKIRFHSVGGIQFNLYVFFSYIIKSVSDTEIKIILIANDEEFDDIHMNIYFELETGIITIVIKNSSFEIKMILTVPTKRFLSKHIRVELEYTQNIALIVQNLNKLHTHTYYGDDQTVITENVQPLYIFHFIRAEMDNISDGMSAYPFDGGSPQSISTFFDVSEEGIWQTEYSYKQKKMGDVRILFNSLAEGIEYFSLEASFIFAGHEINLGERRFPDYSMYNQHYLAKKYVDLFSAIAINSHPELQSYKQLITPFATTAFQYGSDQEMPQPFPDFSKKIINIKNESEIRHAETLTLDDLGVSISISLCPVIADLFVDLYFQDHSNGYAYATPRRFSRMGIDYCYRKIKMPVTQEKDEDSGEGKEERLLKSKNVGVDNHQMVANKAVEQPTIII